MTDIDMKSFTGVNDSAAESQAGNSYQQPSEVPFYPELLEKHSEVVATQPQQSNLEPSEKEINFRALRDEVSKMKFEKEQLQREFELVRQGYLNQNQRQEPSPEPTDQFDGKEDDDVVTVADVRNALQERESTWKQRESNYEARINELEVATLHPDYNEVIEKYALPLFQQKPHLAEGLRASQNRFAYAYEIGQLAKMHSQQTQAPVQPVVSQKAQRIIDNSQKPGTLSQAGGQSTLSQADYISGMSDEEFFAFASKNFN